MALPEIILSLLSVGFALVLVLALILQFRALSFRRHLARRYPRLYRAVTERRVEGLHVRPLGGLSSYRLVLAPPADIAQSSEYRRLKREETFRRVRAEVVLFYLVLGAWLWLLATVTGAIVLVRVT